MTRAPDEPPHSLPLDAAAGEHILSRFMRVSTERGSALAIEDQHGPWTYAEVRAAATQLARILIGSEVAAGDIVAVVGDRCASLVIALLGVSLAGARFVVLDAEQVRQRSLQAVMPLRAKYWLVLESQAGQGVLQEDPLVAHLPRSTLPRGKVDLLHLLERLVARVRHPVSCALPRGGGAQGAYVISTSGTTGTPKLVSTSHRAVLNFLQWYLECFAPDAADRFTLLSGLCHDPLIRDWLVPLSVGGSVRVPTDAQRLDPQALAGWLATTQPTVIHTTPIMLSALAQCTQAAPVPSVRLIGFGGDRLTGRHLTQAHRLFPEAALLNCYGTTETPQIIAFQPIAADAAELPIEGTLPVGTPIPGWQLLILREDGVSLCSPGEVGEIHAASAYLVEGYLNAPEETQKRFLPDPFAGEAPLKMFRTGDLGLYEVNGSVRVLGRCDRQIKVQGNRVELDAVEIELTRHASVAQAAVIFDPQQAQILAYVVPADRAEFSEVALRRHLVRGLPIHALPAKIMVIAALPITANGKLLYSELPALRAEVRSPAPVPADDSHVRRMLTKIWTEELGVDEVRPDQAFLDLGGSSIVASRITSRVRDLLGMELRVMDLFVYPTTHALSDFLREGGARIERDARSPLLDARKRAISNARDLRRKTHG